MIAGVVLTLNEEKDLPRALQSLSWCDELVVVDSGSTDRTQEVAEKCGAHFVQHIQTPPFLITEQRNWALEHSGIQSEWVLFLDADEMVGEVLAEHVLHLIYSSSDLDAYELTPRYWFLGKWLKRTQGFPNWHPRLVRRGRAFFDGGVWESFSAGAKIGRIHEPYEHYAFSKGLDDWILRHLRYASWEAKKILIHKQTRQLDSFGTGRSLFLRRLAADFLPIRPLMRFAQKYIFQAGFSEGWQSLLYCLMISFYDLMIIIKIIEGRRQSRGDQL